VHVLPNDWSGADQFVAPALDRLDGSAGELQLLALTTDAESATQFVRQVRRMAGERVSSLAATSAARGKRLLQRNPVQVVAGPPAEVLQLIQAAALKLDTLRAVVLAWADELVEADAAALENILSELPRDAARVIVASEITPAVEQLVERYARRAMKVADQPRESSSPIAVEYVAAAGSVRPSVLRRVLDSIDPQSASIVASGAPARLEVSEVLADLGYREGDAVRVVDAASAEETQLVIFYGLPSSRADLERAAAGGRVLVIAQPRQLQSLRTMAGGTVKPLALPEASRWARKRDDVVRDELREELAKGRLWREMLALEPLLEDHDGLEIAAAALKLLEGARATIRESEATAGRSASGDMARLFVNIGSRDGVRPGDLVGALTNEVGVDRTAIGKIEMRESFTLVEIDTSVAAEVPAKLSGVSIRGRRVLARLDQQERGAPPRGGRRDAGPGREGGAGSRREGGSRGGAGGPRREGAGPPREGGAGPRREGAGQRGEGGRDSRPRGPRPPRRSE
jgi:ATP-dependent RNA helicase DeaD